MPNKSQIKPHSAVLSATDLTMLLVVLIWGFNFVFVKAALAQLPPFGFMALRFAMAAILLSVTLKLREGNLSIPAGSFWRLIWLGFLGNTAYQTLFMLGISITTAANSALIMAATPVFVAILGRLLRIELITRRMAFGIMLAIIGITMVMTARGAALSRQTLPGDLLVLAGVICWSGYTLGVRVIAAGLSPLRITTLTMLTGCPMLILLGVPQLLRLNWASVDAKSWAELLYSASFSIFLAYILWNRSVRGGGSGRTAIFACVTPLITVFASWPLLGERPVPRQGIGAALIIIGVLLTRYLPRHSKSTTGFKPDEVLSGADNLAEAEVSLH